MRGIAKLLFGDDAGEVLDLFAGRDDGFGLAEQARRSGEWCGTTPGRGSAPGAAAGGEGAGRQRRLPRAVILRDLGR